MVQINGQDMDCAGKTVAGILTEMHYQAQSVAVECNEEIVPKNRYADTVLHDGDCVEIVSFVGGG